MDKIRIPIEYQDCTSVIPWATKGRWNVQDQKFEGMDEFGTRKRLYQSIFSTKKMKADRLSAPYDPVENKQAAVEVLLCRRLRVGVAREGKS